MKKVKKIITICLTVCMLVGLVPNDISKVAADDVKLTVGTEVEININEPKSKVIYEFVPEKDGIYRFESFGDIDSCVYLCEEYPEDLTNDFAYVAFDEDGGDDNNFKLEHALSAEKTYYLVFGCFGTETGIYNILASHVVAPTAMKFLMEDGLTLYEGQEAYLGDSFVFLPENAYEESVSWSSSNETIATIHSIGFLSALSPGKAIITVFSDESDLETSIELTVLEMQQVVEEESVTGVFAKAYLENTYKFIPENNAIYRFCVNSDDNGNIDILDQDKNCIANGSFDDKIIECELVAGNTYYIRMESRADNNSYTMLVEPYVQADGIAISGAPENEIYEGQTLELSAVFSPENAMPENVVWESDNEDVIIVCNTQENCAELFAASSGEATVTATSENGLTAKVEVVVLEATTLSTETAVSDSIETSSERKYYKFVPKIDATYKFNVGQIINSNTCIKNEQGETITTRRTSSFSIEAALKAGETYYVELMLIYTPCNYKITVTQLTEAESLEIQGRDTLRKYVGQTFRLYTGFLPENAVSETIMWESSDTSVATVSAYGEVKLLAAGEVRISARSTVSSLQDSVLITVVDVPTIKEAEEETFILEETGDEGLYKFVPEKDGFYSFHVKKSTDAYTTYRISDNVSSISADSIEHEEILELVAGNTYYVSTSLREDLATEYSILITPYLEVVSWEIESYPTQTTYYHDAMDFVNDEGLKLKVTLEDGTVVYWSTGDGDIYGNAVMCSWEYDEQRDTTATVWITCGSLKQSYEVNIVINPSDEAAIRQAQIWDVMNKYVDPEYHLDDTEQVNMMSDAQYEEIRQAAMAQTADCVTDYEKIKAITAYVSDTIYYDYYAYNNNLSTYTESYEVFLYKRTVCAGYANLTKTMLNSIGIPCMYLRGDNHAYNAAYDGENKRWIFTDATWCSRNRYDVVDGSVQWTYNGYGLGCFNLNSQTIATLSNHETYGIEGLIDDEKQAHYELDCSKNKEEWYLILTDIIVPDTTDTVVIDSQFDDLVVTRIALSEKGKVQCSNISKIDLSHTEISSVSAFAFEDCVNLKEVVLPEGLRGIGWLAFSGCTSLETINIPDSVTGIGMNAFDGCTSLKEVTIPSGVTNISDYAFMNCISLETLIIPESVLTIGKYAFRNCSDLVEVVIPESVTTIGENAFSGCYCLKKITIPKSVTSIGDDAFADCGEWVHEVIHNSDGTSDIISYRDFSIVCYEKSYAHTYAIENDIRYELIIEVSLGDVTEDGNINIRDVMKLKEYLADSESVTINTIVADMDENGKLNIRDVMKLKELLANN